MSKGFDACEQLKEWLFERALPLWASTGTDYVRGGFFEKLTHDGIPTEEPRRARVVGRQIYSFAIATDLGWSGPGRDLVRHGLDFLERYMIAEGNSVIPLVAPDGAPLSEEFDLYDQAFVLFGLAAAARIGERTDDVVALSTRLRERMLAQWKHPWSGFEEGSPRRLPLRANPHMHIFEACLAWVEAGGDAGWQTLADEIANLCLRKFLDPETGALREYFDGDWNQLADGNLDVVEPGHQAEWAWLLIRWGLARGRDDAIKAALRLANIAEAYGVSNSQNLAVNELNRDLSVRDPLMRLWPQTERIKSFTALRRLPDHATDTAAADSRLNEVALQLFRYFDHPVTGAWWEHLDVNGRPLIEPSRASSLYHITCAISELTRVGQAVSPQIHPLSNKNTSGE